MTLTLTNDKIGAIAFTLYVEDEEIDSVSKDAALEYMHGSENIIPGLEKA
jgi:FKBP-type peptidyl-prolyl cis-trans isomerase 2